MRGFENSLYQYISGRRVYSWIKAWLPKGLVKDPKVNFGGKSNKKNKNRAGSRGKLFFKLGLPIPDIASKNIDKKPCLQLMYSL